MISKKDLAVFLLGIFLVITLFASLISAVQPNGASLNEESSETAPADTAGQDEAVAGNITELTVSAFAITQSWQGYFGNVSGAIQLSDGSDNVMYNWSLASPQGEIYSSTNETISWANIQCLNFTSTGARTGESGNGGTTSLYGTNLSQLELQFNIDSGDSDGVDETFALTNHDEFFTANQQFSANECKSTRVYGDSGTGVDQEFEEILLYEPATTSVVYASLLENNLGGFDANSHDFELLVLEDGHGVDTSTTTYYFFVELE